jgi:hypothetical protein
MTEHDVRHAIFCAITDCNNSDGDPLIANVAVAQAIAGAVTWALKVKGVLKLDNED